MDSGKGWASYFLLYVTFVWKIILFLIVTLLILPCIPKVWSSYLNHLPQSKRTLRHFNSIRSFFLITWFLILSLQSFTEDLFWHKSTFFKHLENTKIILLVFYTLCIYLCTLYFVYTFSVKKYLKAILNFYYK